MKAVNIVLGFLIFSIIVSMFFGAIYEILDINGVDGADDFQALSGEYDTFTGEIDNKDSPARDMIDLSKQGEADSEGTDVNIVSGGLAGGRMSVNFFVNFHHIVNNATGDINTSDTYVDRRIINGILAVIVIILAFVIIHFARGFKTET